MHVFMVMWVLMSAVTLDVFAIIGMRSAVAVGLVAMVRRQISLCDSCGGMLMGVESANVDLRHAYLTSLGWLR